MSWKRGVAKLKALGTTTSDLQDEVSELREELATSESILIQTCELLRQKHAKDLLDNAYKLHRRTSELEKSQEELGKNQSELEKSRSELAQAKSELDWTQRKLKSPTALEWSRSELARLNKELNECKALAETRKIEIENRELIIRTQKGEIVDLKERRKEMDEMSSRRKQLASIAKEYSDVLREVQAKSIKKLGDEHEKHENMTRLLQDSEVRVENYIRLLQDSRIMRDSLLSFFGDVITPRTIWMMLDLQKSSLEHSTAPKAVERGKDSTEREGLQDWINYTDEDLAKPLSGKGLANTVSSLKKWHEIASSTSYATEVAKCNVCHLHKISQRNPPKVGDEAHDYIIYDYPSSLISWYDFIPGSQWSPCCDRLVCKTCLRDSLSLSIKRDWWLYLDTKNWIPCPIESCPELTSLDAWNPYSLIGMLMKTDNEATYGKEWYYALKNSSKARATLPDLDPKPSIEALVVASDLFLELTNTGHLSRFYNTQFFRCDPNKDIVLCDMDAYNFKVPFITQYMRTEPPKTCDICAEEYTDFDRISDDAWQSACERFEGPWMHEIFSFPSKSGLACDHPLGTCRHCIARQIATQLEVGGSKACTELSCPICNRKLESEEIKRFATKETFELYQHYQLLEHLAEEPDFRWCLSGTCKSGQLYGAGEFVGPRISCEACGFDMCFQHQVPWHIGLTCAEYQSQFDHTEHEKQTEEWKKQNTKQCPGCSITISKGPGCFHMTCYRKECKHEFCWECLADWKQISTRSGYIQTAHKEGCFFRTSSQRPTGIQGRNLDQALAS